MRNLSEEQSEALARRGRRAEFEEQVYRFLRRAVGILLVVVPWYIALRGSVRPATILAMSSGVILLVPDMVHWPKICSEDGWRH